MKLIKKQKEFLLKIYPFFLSLEPKDINQEKGTGFENEKCGKCFCWWLSYLFDITIFNNKNERCYEEGIKLFNRKMGLNFSTPLFDYRINFKNEETAEFAKFMISCGASVKKDTFSGHPFGADKWKLQPHEVIRNMLERGD